MILVPSRLLRLNGNKSFLVCMLLFMAACSPKITTRKPEIPKTPQQETTPATKPDKRAVDHSIALLLPFELNSINLKTAVAKDIDRAELGIDFYQGVKLALDSISDNRHNYKLHVFDTQNQEARVVNLARAESVRENDIFIGPIFPDEVGTFSEFSDPDAVRLQVSPLAAAMPSQFKNPNLVTVNNTIEQHGWKIADYIVKNYRPDQVNIVLVNTKKTDDEKFAAPVRKYIKELSNGRFQITERPNAIGLQTHIREGKNNLVILCSSDRTFVLPIVNRLSSMLTDGYKIELFGHPNWVKANFLDAQKLQALRTKFSASYFVNYKANNVREFVSRYREEYGLEPSEYSFKGFDIAYFFARLLEKYGKDYASHLNDEQYKGLHNNFRFEKDPVLGYLNTDLMILAYQSLELQPVK